VRARPSAEDAPGEKTWTEADVEAVAVGLLARREHSRAELARKLAARGAPREAVEAVLDRLAARRLQSDARYAESLVNSRLGRGQGPVRIRRELAQQGVEASLVDEALDACGEDWAAAAREVRRRKFGAEVPTAWKDKARQMRFLEYRGFTSEHIRAALGDDDPA